MHIIFNTSWKDHIMLNNHFDFISSSEKCFVFFRKTLFQQVIHYLCQILYQKVHISISFSKTFIFFLSNIKLSTDTYVVQHFQIPLNISFLTLIPLFCLSCVRILEFVWEKIRQKNMRTDWTFDRQISAFSNTFFFAVITQLYLFFRPARSLSWKQCSYFWDTFSVLSLLRCWYENYRKVIIFLLVQNTSNKI